MTTGPVGILSAPGVIPNGISQKRRHKSRRRHRGEERAVYLRFTTPRSVLLKQKCIVHEEAASAANAGIH